MCLEDLRMGRKLRTAMTTRFQVGAASILVAQPSRARVTLRISCSVNSLTIGLTSDGDPINGGIITGTTKPDFELNIEKHGDLVQQGWSARVPANTSYTVIETFYDDDGKGL